MECTSNPNTGEIYHCDDLRCPIHGERNRDEAWRAAGSPTCNECGARVSTQGQKCIRHGDFGYDYL